MLSQSLIDNTQRARDLVSTEFIVNNPQKPFPFYQNSTAKEKLQNQMTLAQPTSIPRNSSSLTRKGENTRKANDFYQVP
jgi:hypothetical protein